MILDLKPSYLESLSEDTHTLTVQFDDGTAETEFTVTTAEMVPGEAEPEDADSPDEPTAGPPDGQGGTQAKTGDDSQNALWALMMAAAALGLVTALRSRRRCR